MFKTILIGTDGSPDSDRALAVARDIAAEQDAYLIVVYITEFVAGEGGRYPAAFDEENVPARISKQVDELTAAGVHGEFIHSNAHLSNAAHVLADIARSADADLIVVGTRGRSPVSEVVLGSVQIRLLQVAHRPVLVVPPPTPEAG